MVKGWSNPLEETHKPDRRRKNGDVTRFRRKSEGGEERASKRVFTEKVVIKKGSTSIGIRGGCRQRWPTSKDSSRTRGGRTWTPTMNRRWCRHAGIRRTKEKG